MDRLVSVADVLQPLESYDSERITVISGVCFSDSLDYEESGNITVVRSE